jgi:tetratricopeptide (TPR) repeat protein
MTIPDAPNPGTSSAGVGALRQALGFLLEHPRRTVLLVVVVAYANTLQNQPVLDDSWVIFNNSLIKSLRNVPAILRSPYNAALPESNAGLYRPVTTLSYAISYAVGGTSVVGYHLVNIGLHALCCLLVLAMGGLLSNAARAVGPVPAPGPAPPRGPAAGPLLGALLFAIHPVHVEAVTAMVGRAELLAALGSLGSLYLTCTRARAWWRYPAALGALALGVLSKENAAVTPLLFGLVALVLPGAAGLAERPSPSSPVGRRALWRAGALAAGMAAAVGIYFVLRPAVSVPSDAQWFGGQPRAVVFNTMTRVVAEYLRLLVFPHPLGLDFWYAHKIPMTPTFTAACVGDRLVWLALFAWGVASWRRAPLRAVGIGWIFLALLPVLNIIPTGVLMAERLLYLPSVGFCIAVGAGVAALPALLARWRAPAALTSAVPVGMAAIFIALLGRTWTRNVDWRNARTLYEAELRREPDDPVVNNNLAVEYTTRGELALARARLEVALRVAPAYWRAQVNMGIVAHRLGDDSVAIAWLERAHEIAPFAPDPDFHLAVVLADKGELPQAVELLGRAERAAPGDAQTHWYRGRYLNELHRSAEGAAELKRAGELDPALR